MLAVILGAKMHEAVHDPFSQRESCVGGYESGREHHGHSEDDEVLKL